ncbi:CHASE domain-containing protein [Qipengyuania flava]|uniref:CHASE domain-containing protein n=1 Tax=Qipengyuania flava TaxID=192812 RepID=UPI001C639CA8|nr:CHASE domain-containing protein [Qipengyuania flava]QYJ06903.1 CHASE domain-containing protein [Qipengyuania flava]
MIFLLIMAITALSVFAIERGEDQRDAADVARKANAMSSAIERRAYTSSAYLRAGAALLATQEEITASLFRRFVSELRLDADYRGAEGIGWAPVIGAGDLPTFEERLSANRMNPKRVVPAIEGAPRDMLTPILFLQPDTVRNRRALGYDMYSEPVRRDAMDTAAANDRPTASGPVVLVQEGGGDAVGFLIYMPVYEGLTSARELKGFIYSPFNTAQFLESASELVSYESVGARLLDIEDDEPTSVAASESWVDGRPVISREISLANRRMMLEVQSARDAGLSTMSMVTLLFGLAVASLLMLVSRLLTQQTLEDRRAIDWFEEQNSIRNSLTRELNHRVKNTLANVLSIVSLTRRRAGNLDEFATGLDGRIRALSATHDLLTQSEWGTTPIRSVVEVELAPYARAEDHRLELSGPHTELAPNDALSLGLALHELATNAAKYGSLSVEGGSVSVQWSQVSDALARIEWVESNGPEVVPPTRRGFGVDLIEKIVAHELRHPVELDFCADGVRCTLLVPIRKPSEFELRQKGPGARGH